MVKSGQELHITYSILELNIWLRIDLIRWWQKYKKTKNKNKSTL
jgi:hypothetical protein